MHYVLDFYRWVVRNELPTVGLLLVVAVGAWAFIELAEEVVGGDTHRLDRQVLLSMRTADDPTDPIGPSWFEEMARDVTALGSVAVLTIFTATMAAYLCLAKQPWIALFVVLSVLGGTAVSAGLKAGFDRPRPALVPHATRIYTKSFPSGHSAMASLTYLTLGAVMARAEKRLRVKALLLVVPAGLLLLVGVSRVYLGVHWPTDVVAGWAFGVSWAAASWLAFHLIARRYRLPVQSDAATTPLPGGPSS